MEVPNDRMIDPRREFLESSPSRLLFGLNVILAAAYFLAVAFLFPHGNPVLFWLLIAGEVFHLWQVFTFLWTVWNTEYSSPQDARINAAVDVFVTVAGEPIGIVEETVRAAALMRYRGAHVVYMLNDGYVAKKENWREPELLAERLNAEGLPVYCITRTVPGGAKAGNINHALQLTYSPLVAMFDADHVPHEDFLEKTAPYFIDPNLGFVQTPQYYKNFRKNYVTRSSWEQQQLFYGPICKGKNRLRSVWMCGTNMLISRAALAAVGGMCTESIAEDAVTGLMMHQRGYHAVYVPEVLAEGLATEDLLTYSKQQFRWARGALDIIFRYNPLFMNGLTFAQKLQYLSSASFYLSGIVVFIDIMLPLVFFYTGLVPIQVSGMLLALFFLPYMFVTLWSIQKSSNYTFTYPSLAFSMDAFPIHIQAFFTALLRRKSGFSISSKSQVSGNFIQLATPHLLYIAATAIGVVVALLRSGFTASFVNNLAWASLNITVFMPFIRAALPERSGKAVQLAVRDESRQPYPASAFSQAYGISQS